MNPSAMRDVSRRTQVFKNDLKVIPLSWRNDPVERIYGCMDDEYTYSFVHESFGDDHDNQFDNVIGYFMRCSMFLKKKRLFANDLPVEFFNHELMAVNINSEQTLFEFVTKWGFPYSPARNEKLRKERFTFDSLEIEKRNENACSLTYRLENWLHALDNEKARQRGYIEGNIAESNDFCDFKVISLEEVRLSILTLQTAVEEIWNHFKHGGYVYLGAINRASCRPLAVCPGDYSPNGMGGELVEYGLLTSAICNQIIDTIAEETPWRACACEGCEVVFKRKQSGVLSPYSESIYCCKRCEERQKKRNQRATAKKRIQH